MAGGEMQTGEPLWWQRGVVYQVYPPSFRDASGDGVGDLRGVTEQLAYLSETLGVDAVWLSPFYPSPMADFGYDVSDFTDVDPLFGTLADFDALLAAAHARGLKLIVDFVPNHSSDQHPWFRAARASRDSPYRDWYVWADPKPDGSPPNNWLSTFGGSAWAWDARSGQYYLHSFLGQPRVAIGELHLYDWEGLARFYGRELDELHLPFNFGLLRAPWQARAVDKMVDAYQAALPVGAWPNYVLGNHDEPRIASRVGREQARLAMLLLLTLRGTPTLYYGDELGMQDVPIPPERVQDPWGRRMPELGRDPQRAPLPWDGGPNAGFCPPGVEPWL